MPRKIVLTIAMSIDGYIADDDGGYNWIKGDDNHILDTPKKWVYHEFLSRVDTVVMGRKCYDQGMHKDFPDKKVYIVTSKKKQRENNCIFIGSEVISLLQEEKQNEGKDIFIFGGGILVTSFLKQNIIDDYYIGIIPVILGKGRKLFVEECSSIVLKLREIMSEEGIVVLHYVRR